MIKRKPVDLMIIGVEKAGTTALYRHLGQSPLLSTHEQREMFFYLSDHEYKQGWNHAREKYFAGEKSKLRVAKNVMQICDRWAMERLAKHCPGIKAVLMLREPAARAWSAYNYALLRGAESAESFAEALSLEFSRREKSDKGFHTLFYRENSRYADKIRLARDMLGPENVLILFHEEYISNPRHDLSKIEGLLGMTLFDGLRLDFSHHNSAAQARSRLLAKWLYRVLQSRNPLKRFVRRTIPHSTALTMRHSLLNFNRLERPNPPLDIDQANSIRASLADDRTAIVELVGRCPW